MYLLYDVLRLRNASLGYKLLAKRRDWNRIQNDLNSLTVARIREAINQLSNRQQITDPTITALLRHLRSIGTHEPLSFAQKLTMRDEMKAVIVRLGMIAWWLTVNPSDLSHPLVLELAGISISHDRLPRLSNAVRRVAATSNPAAVAEFFHRICMSLFDDLLRSGSDELGILGKVSGHYGVVETNGRGMFHIHTLVWHSGNFTFEDLRTRVLNDSVFANRIISFLESIIVNAVEKAIGGDESLQHQPPFPSNLSDEDFMHQLDIDSQTIANKTQRHSANHNATCFKYGNKSKCRFSMPRELVQTSYVDDRGVVHVKRSDPWITSYNSAIATSIRSNHDISWVPTSTKALALVHYLTNYATKADISPQQMLLKAALLTESKERLESNNSGDSDLSQDSKFLLRWYNSLAHDQEISGVQIASRLLGFPTHYSNYSNFVHVGLWSLRLFFRSLLQIPSASDGLDGQRCILRAHGDMPLSKFDNYRWRGPWLQHYCFYEYCMLVRRCPVGDATSIDCPYDPEHPKYGKDVQRLAKTSSQVSTVCFHGSLSDFQDEEERVQRGHPNTPAIKNDLAEILLAFFVPTYRILPLFETHCPDYMIRDDAYTRVWNIVEPTLPAYVRRYARNFGLLKKSKEEVLIDMTLRAEDGDLDNIEVLDAPDDLDDFMSENLSTNLESILRPETLVMACHSILSVWRKDGFSITQQFPMLNVPWPFSVDLKEFNLSALDTPRLLSSSSSRLQLVTDNVMRQWEAQLAAFSSSDTDDDPVDTYMDFMGSASTDANDDGLQPILQSLLSESELENLDDFYDLLLENPSASAVIDLVSRQYPLNRKQRLVAERVISEALAWKDNAFDASKRAQSLVYIGGEGGTGKSQIVRAVVAAMILLGRLEEIILMAPTGAAADNIDGNTYHTSLGISIGNRSSRAASQRIQRLWAKKTIMIIDEISMVDLQSLSRINNRCKIARALPVDSPDLFGGLPVVIFMGDFYQFPPVRGLPLWREPRENYQEEVTGHQIWRRFTQVIILDEQMRQAEDLEFQGLLRRARNAQLTIDDVDLLNTRVIPTDFPFPFHDFITIVRSNAFRHRINHLAIIQFARSRNQLVYIFPADHSRLPLLGDLRLEDIYCKQDEGVSSPSQGLFLYTAGMPCMVLANINSKLGLVNGSRGIATGVVIEPNGK
jgi:Helitron helicase-like domain at N-terminus/PIF1-like helicase